MKNIERACGTSVCILARSLPYTIPCIGDASAAYSTPSSSCSGLQADRQARAAHVSHPALLKTPIMTSFIPGADEELVHVHHEDVGAANHVRRGLNIAENEGRGAVSNILT
jgi:hypothetical protein